MHNKKAISFNRRMIKLFTRNCGKEKPGVKVNYLKYCWLYTAVCNIICRWNLEVPSGISLCPEYTHFLIKQLQS